MPTKLIIIRGNSGSGKTTVAKEVRTRIGDGLSDDTMLVQQDVLRRDILRERDMPDKRAVIKLYYFDIPFEETLVRHASKSNTHEFGEKEMREWWNEKDYLNMPNEKILHTDQSLDDIVHEIIHDISSVE